MNSISLVGNLVRDPELRFIQGSGKAVARLTIAVNRDGSKDKTDFINVNAWGKTAENCANYLKKGSKVAVSGSVQTGSYANNEGTKIYTTEVLAYRVDFLSMKIKESVDNSQIDSFDSIEDDCDIPF